MPAGFELDKKYDQPVLSCGLPGEAAIFDKLAAPHCPSGSYRVDIALLPLSGEEREAILRTRGEAAP
jgi:type II secretory pathway predicted ATPase ExeA